MIFESKKEQDKLMSNIRKALNLSKSKDELKKDKENVGGELPLDKVLPPAAGHASGERTPNTSAYNQPFYGGDFVEDLNTRLSKLIVELGVLDTSAPRLDQTGRAQAAARGNTVGVTGVEGHAKGNEDPDELAKSKNKARRSAEDPMAAGGRAQKSAKIEVNRQAGKKSSDDMLKQSLGNETEAEAETGNVEGAA